MHTFVDGADCARCKFISGLQRPNKV